MDFLNQASAQIRDLLLSMTPAARVTALLLVGVIGISLGYLFQHHTASPDGYLFNGEFLPPRDADRAEAAIAQAGLNLYERVGNRIRVPRGQKAEYLAAVADAGALPPNFHSLLENALDVGPFVDPETRKQRLKAAREQQLSMIVRSMHGIEEAQVIYDIREARGLSKTGQVTAMVSVEPTPGEAIDPRRVKMIKKAVAGAIAGLASADVNIANLGDGSFLGDGGASGEMFDDPYFQHRIAFERHMKSNIEDLLGYIPGVKVQVTAELDEAIERTTRITKPEGEGSPLRQMEETETTESSKDGKGGRPGLSAQGPGRANDPSSAEQTVKNKTEATSIQTENLVGTKDEFLRESGLIPKHVRAGIAIPHDYLISVWREQQHRRGEDPDQPLPDTIDTDLEGIKKNLKDDITAIVAPLLPKELAKENFSDVNITFFESLKTAPIEGPSTAGQALAWASQNFSTMTMAGIALFGLVMLRSVVKAIPPSDPIASYGSPTLPISTGSIEAETKPEETKAKGSEDRPRLKLNKGPNLKDDLAEIVQEDPDAAAAILRSWISNAG